MEIVERDAWFQMDRRMREVSIDNLENNEDEIKSTRERIDVLAKAAELEIAFPTTDDFITRVMHGGLWRFGLTMQLVKMSIESAIYDDEGGAELKHEHFVKGYKRLSRCGAGSNVIIAGNWDRIVRQVGRDGRLSSKFHLLAD
jgi:hypothetical protein